eukprot:Sro1466_g275050.2  (359) ;mRNA; r:12714-13790
MATLTFIVVGSFNISDNAAPAGYPSFLAEPPSWTLFRGYWKSERQCRALAKQLRETHPTGVCRGDPKCPTMVHTETLMSRGDSLDPRQEQLLVLSFLATQHSSLILNILVSEADFQQPPKWLSSLLEHEEYGKRIQLNLWDFGKLDLHPDQLEGLQAAYNDIPSLASKSDLRRYAVLYHYGGLWLDTDTIFVNDVRPLMGLDFVYVAGKMFNGAAMGASRKQSTFMRRIIEHAVYLYKYNNDGAYYRFAGYLFQDLWDQKPAPFFALSGCLFDDGWGGHFQQAPASWSDIWSRPTTRSINAFFQDPNGVFTYHWHGHGVWGTKIQPKSFASVAHANYVRQLQLDPTIFHPAEEEDWKQ